jgi:hypothetical protein
LINSYEMHRAWYFIESFKEFNKLLERCTPGLPSGVRYLSCRLKTDTEYADKDVYGYVELTKPRRMFWLAKTLSETAFWNVCKDTREEAREFCRIKESADKTWEFGIWYDGHNYNDEETQDLLAVQKKIHDGVSLEQISRDDFYTWIKYHKAIEKYAMMHAPKPKSEVQQQQNDKNKKLTQWTSYHYNRNKTTQSTQVKK